MIETLRLGKIQTVEEFLVNRAIVATAYSSIGGDTKREANKVVLDFLDQNLINLESRIDGKPSYKTPVRIIYAAENNKPDELIMGWTLH